MKPQNPYAAEAMVPLSGFAYYLDHFYGIPGVILHKIKAGFLLAWRCTRLALVKAGFPLNRPFLVFTCPGGTDAAGLFAEFGSVLGMLEHYDKWQSLYSGIGVDFKDQGLYFDPAYGPNWWSYYFEPFAIGSAESAASKPITARQHDTFAHRAENTLSRKKGATLINRYIRVKPQVAAKVEAFVQTHFNDHLVIGIHYRGTDKVKEAPRIPYETVCASVQTAINNAKAGKIRIFVATDEQAFVDCVRGNFPQLACSCDAIRSTDGTRVHDSDENNYRNGEEAIIDCLLLSRCDLLIRTESNLGLCATFFNPAIPQLLLNRI